MQHITLKHKLFPKNISVINCPPKELFIKGDIEPLLKRPRLAVVGSRKASIYGQNVTEQIVRGIVPKGVVIVSGLALGIDSIAHKATLEAGGQTIAILPSGLDNIYPISHSALATQILRHKGALISEYTPNTKAAFKSNFIARNRLIAAFSDAVLITEAALKSGSLHTANFALEQGKDVLVIPGPITSDTYVGCNNLIKSGATPITSPEDVLNALNIQNPVIIDEEPVADTKEEYIILSLLKDGINDTDELLAQSKLDTTIFQQTLSMLEITGRIKSADGGKWILR